MTAFERALTQMTAAEDKMEKRTWNDADYANEELKAALEFWRQYHSVGARRRVREACRYIRSVAMSTKLIKLMDSEGIGRAAS